MGRREKAVIIAVNVTAFLTKKCYRNHQCRQCQKFDRNITNRDIFIESDGNFAFNAGYTEGGIPFGITHEEWFEMEEKENRKAD
ncbi:hypothetical protein [Cytobacillus gottheilii]|uniref:hypothetical protein n=1 Tax=Cytobacillus gottheilii TaxID=859144 RepID=UPI0009BA969F|nr:hypothetical protein [Cytobacillus gottheilii]